MKKILFLGGSTQQIPVIDYARKQGHKTILCDYLSDNPGQYYVDKFYCVSTTDKEAVLKVAISEDIDGIIAYASDPAAPIAAYVGNKLGLPSNPYEGVITLVVKDRFRQFLEENGFETPKSMSFKSYEAVGDNIETLGYPVIVKPVDSSGSKGVMRVDSSIAFKKAFDCAMSFSRERRIIVERFIEKDHEFLITGEAFVVEGKLEFITLINGYRSQKVSPYVPIGNSVPSILSEERIKRVEKALEKIINLVGIRFGGLNIDVIYDKQDRLYIVEIGARSGGNMIPDMLKKATDMDIVKATVETALGSKQIQIKNHIKKGFFATYIIHTSENGMLENIYYADEIKPYIVRKVIYKKIGDKVSYFDGANKAIGIVFLEFDSKDGFKEKMEHMDKLICAIVKKESVFLRE